MEKKKKMLWLSGPGGRAGERDVRQVPAPRGERQEGLSPLRPLPLRNGRVSGSQLTGLIFFFYIWRTLPMKSVVSLVVMIFFLLEKLKMPDTFLCPSWVVENFPSPLFSIKSGHEELFSKWYFYYFGNEYIDKLIIFSDQWHTRISMWRSVARLAFSVYLPICL